MLTWKLALIFVLVLGIIYLILIMPRMTKRPDVKPHLNVMYAHRGLFDNASDAPENTMAAFKKAVDAGYGIECDVQLTKDGVPVIFHDFTLNRVARYPKFTDSDTEQVNNYISREVPGKVIDYTYDELMNFRIMDSDERIPKFEEFLELVGGKVPLIIELKIELKDLSVCPKVDNLLKNYKGVYCIESFNPLGLLWYRLNHPDIMRGQLSDRFYKEDPAAFRGVLYFVLAHLLFNFLTKPDFIAYDHKYPNSISLWINRNLYRCTTAAWTIKNQEQLVRARRYFDIYIFDSFIPN